MTARRIWTQVDIDTVRRRYPHERTDAIARDLGRTISQVYNQAHGMGLHKTPEYFERENAGRIQRGRTNPEMVATQFRKGHETWNKGQHFEAGGRSHETRFKAGEMRGAAQHNYVPIGSTRINYGNLERKISDDHAVYPAKRWRPVHRIVWEAANGPVPDGHICVFKPGLHTTRECDITLDRIECITRSENMRRNTIHRYPKDVVRTVQQMNWLQRRVRQAEKQLEETT